MEQGTGNRVLTPTRRPGRGCLLLVLPEPRNRQVQHGEAGAEGGGSSFHALHGAFGGGEAFFDGVKAAGLADAEDLIHLDLTTWEVA